MDRRRPAGPAVRGRLRPRPSIPDRPTTTRTRGPPCRLCLSRLRRRPSRQPGRCTCNGPPHHGIGEMEGMVGSNSPAGACAGPHGPAWMDAPPGRALPRMSFHDTQKLVKNWFNSSLRPTPPPRDFFLPRAREVVSAAFLKCFMAFYWIVLPQWTSRLPRSSVYPSFHSASSRVTANHGQPFSRAQRSTSTWPFSTA